MNNIFLKLKDQQIHIIAFVFLVIGVLIFIQSILFVFDIGSQLMVPLHLFSATSALFPAQFFHFLNFIAWLAVIFFVCIVGIMVIRKGIALLKLHQDTMFAKNIDQDEITQICNSYERFL